MFARFGPRYRYYVSFTAMLGTMAMALTATMTNVAIPVIMGTFGVGQDKVHWVSTGFIAAMTFNEIGELVHTLPHLGRKFIAERK